MKTRKIVSAFFSLCLVLSMLLMPLTVGATTENAAVVDAKNGIVQVMYAAKNAEGKVVDIYGGTGFLIGVESEGSKYVITNHHVIDPFHVEYMNGDQAALDAEKQYVWDQLGIPYDQKIEITIRVVLKRDTYYNATIVDSSMSTDFAILELEDYIYGERKPLVLADSDQLTETQEVYALGFPAIVQAMQEDKRYTPDDVTVMPGKISKLSESKLIDSPIPCINHSATITAGNSGGPLLNANGEVVGINRHSDVTGSYYYSVQINEITDVLDMRGIAYQKAGETASEPADADAEVVTDVDEVVIDEPIADPRDDLFDALENLIKDAKQVDTTVMTEESVANFEDALEAAKDVYDDADSSEDDLETAIEDLTNAKTALVEAPKGLSPMVIVGIIAGVVVVLVIVIVLVINSNNKKKRAEAEKEKQRRAAMSMNQKPSSSAGYQAPKPPVMPPMMDDGADATGILNDGSSETTVLGGGQSVPPATLIRKKNNENITISKQVFKLGKERRKVDYCIADNTNISRTHADIVYKNGAFYIVDNHATNGTAVNGATVASGQERILKNNDIIKLADEEFQFRSF